MLLLSDGSILGSVGGGPMEWAVMRMGADMLAAGQPARLTEYDLGGADAETADSICGGRVRLCLYPLRREDLAPLDAVCQRLSAHKSAGFGLWQEGDALRLFCLEEGRAVVSGPDDGLGARIPAACAEDAPGLLYYETIAPRPRLWLIGGGHVALATAQVAAIAGFDIVVVDDRAEYANETRFPGARCIVCGSYDELPPEEILPSDYIAILTRGHRHDRESLAWALGTEACYVGMIGSKRKIATIYQLLRDAGVPQEKLDRVHAPIGLPIGDHTPGDIAISIVAELISLRAEKAGDHTPHKK